MTKKDMSVATDLRFDRVRVGRLIWGSGDSPPHRGCHDSDQQTECHDCLSGLRIVLSHDRALLPAPGAFTAAESGGCHCHSLSGSDNGGGDRSRWNHIWASSPCHVPVWNAG